MIPNQIIKSRLLTPSEKELYNYIRSFKEFYGSYQHISQVLGMAPATIRKCIKKLLDLGLIRKIAFGKGRASHTYVVTEERYWRISASKNEALKEPLLQNSEGWSSESEALPLQDLKTTNTNQYELNNSLQNLERSEIGPIPEFSDDPELTTFFANEPIGLQLVLLTQGVEIDQLKVKIKHLIKMNPSMKAMQLAMAVVGERKSL